MKELKGVIILLGAVALLTVGLGCGGEKGLHPQYRFGAPSLHRLRARHPVQTRRFAGHG